MPRLLYRVRQVGHALWPRLDDSGPELVRMLLPEDAAKLFFAMERRDQRHALEVTHRLIDNGIDDDDLLAAALLHDCGKGAVPVWLRVVKVLSPGALEGLGRAGDAGWRGAAYRLAHHPELGAAMAAQAGLSGVTVSLIRGQVVAADEHKLALLQAADDAS